MSLEAVAKKAGVSTATVSRVLNGITVVKGSTRSRVIKAVADLKYHPNLHARSLAGGRSRTVGVIVSNLDNPFFLDVYRAVESDCHAQGYEVVVANTAYNSEQLLASVRLMIGRRVAGLAVIVSEIDEAIIQELTEVGVPVVFYDVGNWGKNITKIRVNYHRGVQKIVECLTALGHKNIGFITHHSALGPLNARQKALFDCLDVASPDATVAIFVDSDSLEGGRQAARQMLLSGPIPTAVICVNDLMAVGVLKELREKRVRVPEDVSVTGFDNIKLSEFCYPALTTVHIPRDIIGHTLFRTLTPDVNGEVVAGREYLIDPEFVVRDSTGPARTTELTL